MEFQCPICLEEEMGGRILQCNKGHAYCYKCYTEHVARKDAQGTTPRCPQCRTTLKNGVPVYCLAVEQAIAARKQAVIDEVRQAEVDANVVEVAHALAAADALAATEEEAAAARVAATLHAHDEEQAKQAEQAADASALALAQAAGDGGSGEQAKKMAEYAEAARVKRVTARVGDGLKALVRSAFKKLGTARATAKGLRHDIEDGLGLNRDDLKPDRRDIAQYIDEELAEVTCGDCRVDMSGDADLEELRDPLDDKPYCAHCWKALALDTRHQSTRHQPAKRQRSST